MTGSMEAAITTAAAYGLGAMGVAASAVGLKARLELSKAKHRSLGGHSRIADSLHR
jgi:glutamate-1-semialdehyde 2,1-aminomutase